MKRVILLVNFGRAVGRRQAHHQFQQKVIQRQKKFTFDKELAKTTGNIPHDQNEMSLAAAHFARESLPKISPAEDISNNATTINCFPNPPPSDDSPSQVILPFSQENLTKSSQIQENDDFPENEFNFARKKDEASDLECEEVVQPVDRGFFIYDGELVDQYTAATTADLPDDEYSETDIPISYHGVSEGAIEDIEFQMPGQESLRKKKEKKTRASSSTGALQAANEQNDGEKMLSEGSQQETENWVDEHSTKTSTLKCAGCGAAFHCQNPSLPGFVPIPMFADIEKEARRHLLRQKTDNLCRRCHLHKNYNFLLNVNVCKVDYVSVMRHLKLVPEALILLVLDMSDLQGSICRELPKIIGENKPVILIGNKVDLLPPDTEPGYLKHYRTGLINAVREAGFTNRFNILKYQLISAKTGFGVEDLITNIFMCWLGPRGVLRANIYVVGSTNVGKSTLFNAFLQSDLCKVRALDLVERVTTSMWPGTTLSLLKFPVMNPTPQRMELRRQRLLSMQTWRKKEKYFLSSIRGNPTDNLMKASQHYEIANTFKEMEEDSQAVSRKHSLEEYSGETGPEDELLSDRERKSVKNISLNSSIFARGHWCYDTPGTVNQDQVLGDFTLEELIHVIPRSTLIPRIFILRPRETLLVAAIGRIDVLETIGDGHSKTHPNSVYLIVFASRLLPINVVETKAADRFLSKYAGTSVLKVPIGDWNRMNLFPKLERREYLVERSLDEKNYDPLCQGIADLLLSSIGWAMVSSQAKSVRLQAWTPGGKGLACRMPPLVPFALKFRGGRISGTNGYKTVPFDRLAHLESRERGNRLSRGPSFDLEGED